MRVDSGAINNDIDGFLFLTNCTITNNSSLGLAASPDLNTQTVEVRNTIIAGNTGGDIGGNFISRGNNLIGSPCIQASSPAAALPTASTVIRLAAAFTVESKTWTIGE